MTGAGAVQVFPCRRKSILRISYRQWTHQCCALGLKRLHAMPCGRPRSYVSATAQHALRNFSEIVKVCMTIRLHRCLYHLLNSCWPPRTLHVNDCSNLHKQSDGPQVVARMRMQHVCGACGYSLLGSSLVPTTKLIQSKTHESENGKHLLIESVPCPHAKRKACCVSVV